MLRVLEKAILIATFGFEYSDVTAFVYVYGAVTTAPAVPNKYAINYPK